MSSTKQKSRRQFLWETAFAAAALSSGCTHLPRKNPGEREQNAPNLIVICLDDFRWNFFEGESQFPWLKTPHIASLIARGVRFDNAFVTTSICAPSRSSMLTGYYASRTGIRSNDPREEMAKDLPTFNTVLKNSGYATAYCGKVHIPNMSTALKDVDDTFVFDGQGRYFNNTFFENGQQIKRPGYVTDEINQWVTSYLKKKKPDQPFVLFVGHKAPHIPHTPAPRHETLYQNVDPELPKTADDTLGGRPKFLIDRRNSDQGLIGTGPAKVKERILQIGRQMAAVDEGIGEIRSLIDSDPALKNTILILTGDNGLLFGEHGQLDKRLAYEESIRIPLIVYSNAGFAAPGRRPQMVLNIDLFPTLLEFALAPYSTPVDGTSWKSYLGKPDTQGRQKWLYQYFHDSEKPITPTHYAVRSDTRKYIRISSSNSGLDTSLSTKEELYDLTKDPFETKNVIAKKAYKKDLIELREFCDSELRRLGLQKK